MWRLYFKYLCQTQMENWDRSLPIMCYLWMNATAHLFPVSISAACLPPFPWSLPWSLQHWISTWSILVEKHRLYWCAPISQPKSLGTIHLAERAREENAPHISLNTSYPIKSRLLGKTLLPFLEPNQHNHSKYIHGTEKIFQL
jgi:hypothetical protein